MIRRIASTESNQIVTVAGVALSMALFVAMILYPMVYIQGFLFIRPLLEPLSAYQLLAGFPVPGLISGLNIVCLIVWAIMGRTRRLLLPNSLPLYLLIFLGSLSFINSPFINISVAHMLRLMSWLSLGVLVYNCISNRRDIIKVLAAISFSSVIPMFTGFVQFIAHRGEVDPIRGAFRVQSLFVTTDSWGVFVSLCLIATTFLYLEARSMKMRTLSRTCIPILVLLLFSLGLTYHRGSWIALCAAALIALTVARRFKLVIGFVFVTVLIGLVFHEEIWARFRDLFVKRQYGFNSWDARLILWRATLSLVPNHLVIGHGVGCGKEILAASTGGSGLVPHNDYFRLLLEVGVTGFMFYFWFLLGELVNAFRMLRRKGLRPITAVLFGTLTYFCIISFAQNIIYDVINMGLVFSLLVLFKKRVAFEPKPV